jgi:hypothetical protein
MNYRNEFTFINFIEFCNNNNNNITKTNQINLMKFQILNYYLLG